MHFPDSQNVSIISAIVTPCLYLPLILYHGSNYYKNKNHIALKQRYANITITEIICCIIYITSWNAYEIFSNYNCFDNPNDTFWQIIYFILSATIQIFETFLYALWILRFWMIRFDMKFSIASIGEKDEFINKHWQQIIDPYSIESSKYKWYINKKMTLGNIRWMIKYFMLPWMIFWVLFTCSSMYSAQCFTPICNIMYQVTGIGYMFDGAFTWILLYIIYFTIPKFQDCFFISDELKRLMIIYVIITMNEIMLPVASYFFETKLQLIRSVYVLTQVTCMTATSLISTWWVLNNLKRINIVCDNYRRNGKIKHRTYTKELLLNSIANEFDTMQARQLKQILMDCHLFEVYIKYLSKELCIQYIIAFIEMIQMQQYIMKCDVIGHEIDEKYQQSLAQNIGFYPDMVRSFVVFGDEMNDCKWDNEQKVYTLKIKSDKLIDKYIINGAQYQINIFSNNTLNKMLDDLDNLQNINVNEILYLWDQITKRLFLFLLDGFPRFQSTLQYSKLNLQRLC
eukprot:275693_1